MRSNNNNNMRSMSQLTDYKSCASFSKQSGSNESFESDESVLAGHKKNLESGNSTPLHLYVCICISMALVLCFPVLKEDSEP